MINKSTEPKKFVYIDALRGLAAVGVIAHHIPRKYLGEKIGAFLEMGAGGVPLFFMLSALTLFISYNNRRLAEEKNPTINFFIRRIFRIAPLFYVLIIYSLWQDGFGARNPVDPDSVIGVGAILSNLTFTFGLHPYWISSIVPSGWSVGTEMIFYLIIPFLYRHIRSLYSALWLIVASVFFSKIVSYLTAHNLAANLSPTMLSSKFWTGFLYQFFPAQAPIFSLGILLFYLINLHGRERISQVLKERPNSDYAYPILVFFGTLLISNALHKFSTDGLIPSFVTDYALLYMPLIFALHLNPTKAIVNKFTIYLGKISYSLYLTHSIVLHYVSKYIPAHALGNGFSNYLAHFVVTFIGTVFLSVLTFRFIEKPGQEIGKKLIIRLESSKQKQVVV